MSSISIDCPVSDGDWVFVDANGKIDAWGSASDGLLRIYGRCYPGIVAIAPPFPQKPHAWHGATGLVQGAVVGNTWNFSGNRIPGAAADNSTQTLVIWADFAADKCYDIARRLYVGTAGSGSGCGEGGGNALPPLFRVAPRFYTVSLEADPFDGADPTAGEMPHSIQPKRTTAVLEYDEVAGSFAEPTWRCSANGDGDWLLKVRTLNGQVLASVAWTPPRNGCEPKPLIWDRLGWNANGLNILQHDAASSRLCSMPEVSVAPVG